MAENDQTSAKERGRLPSNLGAILEFVGGEERGRKIPLLFARTVLGRKFGDVLVRDIMVSGTHAALDFTAGGFRLVDLASSNGTFLAGRRVKEARLEAGEEVRIGDSLFRIRFDPEEAARISASQPPPAAGGEGGLKELIEREFFRPDPREADRTLSLDDVAEGQALELVAALGPDRGKRFSFSKRSVVIGRVGADLVLADPDISRKHALLERLEGRQVVLRDLASTNGTFVNEKRISNCVLREGDRIRVGQTVLRFLSGSSK